MKYRLVRRYFVTSAEFFDVECRHSWFPFWSQIGWEVPRVEALKIVENHRARFIEVPNP